MATSRVGRACLYRRRTFSTSLFNLDAFPFSSPARPFPTRALDSVQRRTFTCARCLKRQQSGRDEEPFSTRLGKAWRKTRIEWRPIPIGLGIGFLGFLQFLKVQAREGQIEEGGEHPGDRESGKRPPKRDRIRPSGPWQVQVMSTLPLKALSRLWGRFNELHIPYYLRVPGFKLFGWIFGVNFAEIGEDDLHTYPNLASFFYRTLKPGVRPLDPNPKAVLSPADGRVLQLGAIEHGEVEQVKGMTYRLDALLGTSSPGTSPNPSAPSNIFATSSADTAQSTVSDDPSLTADHEFAIINGISYTLPNLFSGPQDKLASSTVTEADDQSTTPRPSSEAAVRVDLAMTWSLFPPSQATKLYYVVIYLAPGDYHRFHSPVSWVCSSRRHFAGELYSVSPYLQRTLPGLFTLNERVVLLGRWKYGFFSYTPVGATNVGSIKVNFDRELRTNSLVTDTTADREAQKAKEKGEQYVGFSEASYANASKVLGGYALRRGEEMGGFALGSSIVLVFEAPAGKQRGKGEKEGKVKGGWRWNVEKGQRVKVGEALGCVEEE
jgi:phosphatidylserine decarboxylase